MAAWFLSDSSFSTQCWQGKRNLWRRYSCADVSLIWIGQVLKYITAYHFLLLPRCACIINLLSTDCAGPCRTAIQYLWLFMVFAGVDRWDYWPSSSCRLADCVLLALSASPHYSRRFLLVSSARFFRLFSTFLS